MAIIRPISDLRNHAGEISELCKQENQPVFITKNGHGELVVMSHDHYEQREALLQLYEKLAVAEAEEAAGVKGISQRKAVAELRRYMREKAR
jgi:prevent-host-death family protein